MGNEDLGNHFLAIGSYAEAAKAYSRMRDFCTTTKHLLEMNLKLLYIAVLQQNWSAAMSYRAKLAPPPAKDDQAAQAVDAVLTAVAGLAHLNLGQYRAAADRFLAVHPAYIAAGPLAGVDFARRMLAPGDVAVYGSLCALATMAPAELRERVLDNQQFHEFVDLELDLGRAVSLFCGHRYTDCLAALDEYAAECRMDMHLRDHFPALYAEVRARSVARWFEVYSVVSLDSIAAVFPPREGVSTQEEVEVMIEEGRLDARVDVVDQVSRIAADRDAPADETAHRAQPARLAPGGHRAGPDDGQDLRAEPAPAAAEHQHRGRRAGGQEPGEGAPAGFHRRWLVLWHSAVL
jgi:COP9 signalosome complex subunit 1